MRHAAPWRARTEASLLPSKDLNNIIILDLKSSTIFSYSRGVLRTRGASTVARPVLAGAPGSSGVSTIPLRKKSPTPRPAAHLTNPCARPRAAPGTCETAEPRGEPSLPSFLSPEALCLFTAHGEEVQEGRGSVADDKKLEEVLSGHPG